MPKDRPIKTLREWLFEKGLRQEDFAKLLNEHDALKRDRIVLTQQNISRWLGVVQPSVEIMELIEQITGGEVTYRSFGLRAKYEGDKRLVDKKFLKPEVLAKWRNL